MLKKYSPLLLVFILFAASCKKESTDETLTGAVRVKKITYYAPTNPYSTSAVSTYQYDGDHVSQILWHSTDSHGSLPDQKIVFSYPAGQITRTVYNQGDNTWIPSFKTDYFLDGNNLTEERTYHPADTGWNFFYGYRYLYSGENLVNRTQFRMSGDTFADYYREEYLYVNDRLVEISGTPANRDSSIILMSPKKNCLFYSNGVLTERIDSAWYSGIWYYDINYPYSYSGNYLVRIGFETYRYNAPGVLFKETQDITNVSKTFAYDQGKGNAALIQKINDINAYLMNDPVYCSVP
jgi:hypothetical protein